jgi:hypothetical protein
MKLFYLLAFTVLSLGLGLSPSAHAWGRHDLITELSLQNAEFSRLQNTPIQPETIEHAAPDLMKRVMPGILLWCERYHHEHDTRYAWSIPAMRPELSEKQAFLWALEDNTETEFPIGPEKTAAAILQAYSAEPDGKMDEGLESSPYIERLRPSMSYFASNDSHTHAFRHYYVTSSLLPPIIEPKGIAPYRADLYAHLAKGAFATGHPYWGYRFLAWSLHYVQDVTQPWHTVFVPDLTFLKLSKSEMKKEISALHYLTEAFGDSWMENQSLQRRPVTEPDRKLAAQLSEKPMSPWYISELTEMLARKAHNKASLIADLGRKFFKPIVEGLDEDLKLHTPSVDVGGIRLISARLDFSGNGEGATAFLHPIWQSGFGRSSARDQLMEQVALQLESAVQGSQELIRSTLGADPWIKGSSKG